MACGSRTVSKTSRPNQFLVSDAPGADRAAVILSSSPEAVIDAISRWFAERPLAKEIAGPADTGWKTFEERTSIMAYPDFISIKAVPHNDGTKLSIYSRSRFGYRDFDVNKDRVEALLAALAS